MHRLYIDAQLHAAWQTNLLEGWTLAQKWSQILEHWITLNPREILLCFYINIYILILILIRPSPHYIMLMMFHLPKEAVYTEKGRKKCIAFVLQSFRHLLPGLQGLRAAQSQRHQRKFVLVSSKEIRLLWYWEFTTVTPRNQCCICIRCLAWDKTVS